MKLPMNESADDDEEGDAVFLLILEGSFAIDEYEFTLKKRNRLKNKEDNLKGKQKRKI